MSASGSFHEDAVKTLRVLIVEDSEDDTRLVVHHLAAGGYDVYHERVQNEEQWTGAMRRSDWDIVIADYSMPGFSGIAALRLLRAVNPDLPFIFVSGTLGEDLAVGAMKIGASDYIMKGNLARLIPAVERELRDAATRRERRAAGEELRRSEERFRRVFEDASVGMAILFEGGRILDVNHALCAALGYRPAEMIGHHLGDMIHPDEQESLMNGIHGVLERRTESSRAEGRWLGKGDRVVWLDVATTRLHDDRAGSGLGLVIAQDLTERRGLEEQLHHSQKMEAIGRLSGNVAHDFNNLLTVIIGHAQLMREELDETDPRSGFLDEIVKAASRGAELTRHLLAFSRKQIIAPSVFDLGRLVRNVEPMVSRLIGEDIRLEIRTEATKTSIYADEGQIEQIVLNLVVNARDAMPGGGRLLIETSVGSAPVATGEFVLLRIADSGVGMDPSLVDRIFEPYFTTKERGKGTGLGLSSAYGIVTQSGGFIDVSSRPGEGTTFTIRFPRVRAEPTAVRRKPAEGTTTGNEMLLIVEDEVPIRELLDMGMKGLGYRTLTAGDPEGAVKALSEYKGTVNVLITDMILKTGNGRDLAVRLREMQPSLKVLFISGYTEDFFNRSGVLEPGVVLLQKPFTTVALARKIREMLDAPADRPER